jgi:hypothetical protein
VAMGDAQASAQARRHSRAAHSAPRLRHRRRRPGGP